MKRLSKALGRKKYLAAAIPLIMAAQAQGFEFYSGGIEGSFDSQLSLGSSWRMEAPDETLLGGTNINDGNGNYEDGEAFSQIFKGSHDLQVSYENFGAFVRGKYWYDSALEDKNGATPNVAANTINGSLDDSEFNDLAKSSGIALLDAFVYGEFEVADMPLDVRLGKQVVSWGESTFILGGINSINPIDVSSFRRPGAEIKEGLIPVNMAYANIGLTDNLSGEAFYQIESQETVITGCGTYFATNDYAPEGCDGAIANKQVPVALTRAEDNKATDDGQFGVAFRYTSEALGDTEFGLYAMNIHSRVPLISGLKHEGYINAATAAGTVGAANAVGYAVQQNLVNGFVQYQVSYPEDIQLVGVSFATNVGSMALSGEISHKTNVPFQINATQLIAASLTESAGYLNSIGMNSSELIADVAAVGTDEVIQGYRQFDVSQAQVTGIKFFDQLAGASRIILIGEAGYTFVHDFTEAEAGGDMIRFGRAGVFDSLGTSDGFVTESSWGYRARVVAQYSDVFAGINLTPVLAWKHDVEGFAPNPGGAFREGEQSLGLTVKADYLATYNASISYTQFMGGDYSVISDRDFTSISVGMQF